MCKILQLESQTKMRGSLMLDWVRLRFKLRFRLRLRLVSTFCLTHFHCSFPVTLVSIFLANLSKNFYFFSTLSTFLALETLRAQKLLAALDKNPKPEWGLSERLKLWLIS